MFTTPQEVMAATPYTEVTVEQVRQAQFVIEMYVGRTETEVDSARDKSILARAVAAQTVYMRDNPDITFNQIKATTVSQGGRMTVFGNGDDSPFIAPLAVLACKKLSWRQSRSVRTGRWRQEPARVEWVRD